MPMLRIMIVPTTAESPPISAKRVTTCTSSDSSTRRRGQSSASSYAAEPDALIEQLKADEAIAEADTLLLTVPNQLGVAYNADVIEAILTQVAPALGWR
jgi:hypothetical protein